MGGKVREYDVVVVGSGAGGIIADGALRHGLSVALVDRGPLGGTCLNVGCIPSKVLIFPADRVAEVQEASKLGIEAEIKQIDFAAIMARMRRTIGADRESIREGISLTPGLDLYEEEGHFVGWTEIQVGEEVIRGDMIFLASGARPLVPPIEGIEDVDYLTNESVLELTERPESLLIVGGGYISAEYSHFFASMGTEVTVVERRERLLMDEEPEISRLLENKMAGRMRVYTGTQVTAVESRGSGVAVTVERVDGGDEAELRADRLMVAAGRKSNADLLRVEVAGIETDERGYIVVDEYLQTNVESIWALGDAIGKHMFRHVANREADVAWHNAAGEHKVAMDYSAVPHAVFSHPQIASVGLTEERARGKFDILVGRASYLRVAKGAAMMETDGFAKAVVEKASGRILGFHVVGPYAPILVQEVVVVMANGGGVEWLGKSMHIHPALSEVVVAAFSNLKEPE
jgi:mycothione reductase